jgi:hypothetical protein
MLLRTLVVLLFLLPASAEEPENLLRNGSFEGGLLYWHGIEPEKHKLVHGGAKVGEYALRIEKGYVMSAPFVAKRNDAATVSFWVKGDRAGQVSVQMPPSGREEGTRAKRLWTGEAAQRAKIGTEWQRVSFTWMADVPPSGFWPDPHYLVMIESQDNNPILIDGVTVTLGKTPTADYVPRRKIEVISECPDLPGWDGAKGNLLERGKPVRLVLHASNPGAEAQEVVLRHQLFDYEGEREVAPPLDQTVTVPAGKTVSKTITSTWTTNGTVLSRVSVLQGGKVIDQSDLPLTSLPYPKAATKPDWRERFGGSFAGGVSCVDKFQRIGFGWIRWRPHSNGEDHVPKDPKGGPWEWRWFDKEYDEQESRGCSSHCVLYPPPAWIMEKDQPLPKDMRWAPNDPKWDDLGIETVWDKFVKEAVAHYKGRSLIYEIENEPEFDRWVEHKLFGEYAKFTIRTAKLIRQTDPKAKIMVNNVYGIPSSVNGAFFAAGGLKFIDVMSWHDYHAGWLTDATGLRRMRQNLDEAGGKNVEIWFNEGWAFTNTAVDEPPACTGLTSARSTNEIMDCVAELSVTGQKKTVLFHTMSDNHGMSFWDYSGPGTMLWDWYNYPLPLVAAWNVLTHHLGISDELGFVRPPGANLCIFQDLRNGRGVVVAYADRDSKADVSVELPDLGSLQAEDIMGNAGPAPRKLVLSKSGRPVLLYSPARTAGPVFLEKLSPLDRKNASFASASSWQLPASWEGTKVGDSDGSIAMADGKPVWKLEQLWPPDWKMKENFRPMVWKGTDWNVKEGGFGGQPGAALKDRALVFGTRAPHGQPQARRTCGLTFVAPKAGTYALSGSVECRMWDSNNKTVLRLLKKGADQVTEAGALTIPNHGSSPLDALRVTLAAGEEFCLIPEIEGAFAGGDCRLIDVRVTLGGLVYTLPGSWEGVKKGSAEGNPVSFNGKPIWRIDRIYPDKIIMAENYAPATWDGTSWHSLDHEQGGQPSARIESGKALLSVSGPWQNFEYQKIAGLVFIAPESGVYQVKGTASSKPWSGGMKSFSLKILKKDTQRAAELAAVDLPRDATPVPVMIEAELTAGHELVILPLVPDWNNATTITIEALTIEKVR